MNDEDAAPFTTNDALLSLWSVAEESAPDFGLADVEDGGTGRTMSRIGLVVFKIDRLAVRVSSACP